MKGPLHRFFAADHRRLDGLLRSSISEPGPIDLGPFGEFRAGLLKHIGMEERVLFQAARRARGEPLALAALLVPTPTPALVEKILSVLGPHNRREEEPGGVYDSCDEAVGTAEAERLVQELYGFPEVPLKAYNDGPEVLKHIGATFELARRQWLDDEGRL